MDTEWKLDGYYGPAPEGGLDYVCGGQPWKELIRMCLPDEELEEWMCLPKTWLILLEGKAGCGKTFLAKAAAAEFARCGYRFLSMNGGDLKGASAEETLSRMRQLERAASGGEKLFLLLQGPEELEDAQMQAALAKCLSGIKEKDLPAVAAAVTEHPEKMEHSLKKAFIRCHIEPPDAEARGQYFQTFLGETLLKGGRGIRAEKLADLTEGFDYAQLERLRLCIIAKVRRIGLESFGSIKDLKKAVEEEAFVLTERRVLQVMDGLKGTLETERREDVWEKAGPPQDAAADEDRRFAVPGAAKENKYPAASGAAKENKYPAAPGAAKENKYPAAPGSVEESEYPAAPAADEKQQDHSDVMEDLGYLDPANIDWGF